MKLQYFIAVLLAASIVACTSEAQQPGVEQFKKVFEAQMQKLKPEGYTRRTVKFGDVVAGKPNGGYYPFKVTAYVHDYGPGYPANKYYGQTCLGKMEGWKFDMRKDDFGEWIVQGRFTITGQDAVCQQNPSEGAEAIPLAGVPGTVYQPAKTATTAASKTSVTKDNAISQLYIGEYASYGTGSRLLAGMGFILKSDGTYTDLDKQRGGKYIYNAQQATISFKGGFLDGQVGKNVRPSGFQLTATVSCEPWR